MRAHLQVDQGQVGGVGETNKGTQENTSQVRGEVVAGTNDSYRLARSE